MGEFLYNLSIGIYNLSIQLAAVFNTKAKLLVNGRKATFSNLQSFNARQNKVVWVHCASLGEFEQGRPLIEAIKAKQPETQVILSFFSPSGYEVRKNYPLADIVLYLPSDNPKNAAQWLDLARPDLAIFVKYEFWYHYLKALQAQSIPTLSISAIFRKEQLFFNEMGGFYRGILGYISHFFVQNPTSEQLLNAIGIKNVSISGDTRFDRVTDTVANVKPIDSIKQWVADDRVLIVGSAWLKDLAVIKPLIQQKRNGLKFIIAPHDISEKNLSAMEKQIGTSCVRYSAYNEQFNSETQCLLIDNMGMLASIYQYGNYAFIGGAFGKGLHNILEAAAFGLPVFFGDKNYKKFDEALGLIKAKGATVVSNARGFEHKFDLYWNNTAYYEQARQSCLDFVNSKLGATTAIMNFIEEKRYL